MTATVRSELRKLLSTRLWWILLLAMTAYMMFLGAVLAFSLTTDTGSGRPMTGSEVIRTVYSLGTSLGYGFPLVVGALVMTNEFRHQTITPTLLFQPRRTHVLAAKLTVATGVGVLFGLAGTAGAVAGGAPVLAYRDIGLGLDQPAVWAVMAFSVVALTIWAAAGVGLGTVLPNQVASIVVILGFTQFVEPVLRLGLGAWGVTEEVAKFLPGAAAEAIAGSSFYSESGSLELLGRVPGAVVLICYVVVLAVVGRLTTLRRDVT